MHCSRSFDLGHSLRSSSFPSPISNLQAVETSKISSLVFDHLTVHRQPKGKGHNMDHTSPFVAVLDLEQIRYFKLVFCPFLTRHRKNHYFFMNLSGCHRVIASVFYYYKSYAYKAQKLYCIHENRLSQFLGHYSTARGGNGSCCVGRGESF